MGFSCKEKRGKKPIKKTKKIKRSISAHKSSGMGKQLQFGRV